MTELAIWTVTDGKPTYFERGAVNLEKQLEEWIERDPRLVHPSLFVVGRQIRVESGILDLLAIDQIGRWAVIEIKRGNVTRNTITQALDYAACIDEMPAEELTRAVQSYLQTRKQKLSSFLQQAQLDETIFDEREIILYVVGTGRDQDLERVTKFLRKAGGITINVVNFDVFENGTGERIIVRQLTELDSQKQDGRKTSAARQERDNGRPSIESLLELADRNGVGSEFRMVYEAAIRHGLYPRIHKWSIMYTPPSNKTRVLICAWAKPRRNRFDIFVYTPGFAEFFPISEHEATETIGPQRRTQMTMPQVEELDRNLDVLFKKISENQ